MKPLKPLMVIFLVLLCGCATLDTYRAERNFENKVQFDFGRLDQDGLYGVSDGKRALSYEFCIPASLELAQQVMDIDPSVIIYKDSKGRVGCTDQQYLAMGDTFQKEYLVTLQQLVNLNDITRIIEVHFE